jgi:hypothetical protein
VDDLRVEHDSHSGSAACQPCRRFASVIAPSRPGSATLRGTKEMLCSNLQQHGRTFIIPHFPTGGSIDRLQSNSGRAPAGGSKGSRLRGPVQ